MRWIYSRSANLLPTKQNESEIAPVFTRHGPISPRDLALLRHRQGLQACALCGLWAKGSRSIAEGHEFMGVEDEDRRIALTERESLLLLDRLEHPPRPTEHMLKAMARRRELLREHEPPIDSDEHA